MGTNGNSNGNGYKNGTNGTNGHSNGTNGHKLGDISYPGGFVPSSRMTRFRNLAIEASSKNKVRVAQWRAMSTDDPRFEDGPVTRTEWANWEAVEGFKAWFDGYFDVELPTAREFAQMDNAFWDGLMKGMAAGQDWAFRAYSKARIEPNLPKEPEKKDDLIAELQGWLSQGGGGAWRRQAEA